MTAILALDLATKTGWAAWGPGRPLSSGTIRLQSTGPNVGRYLHHFDLLLSDLITTHEPSLIIFEAPILPRTTNLATARKLYSLAGLTELVAHRREIEIREVNNKTVRKHFIGTGGGKRDVIKPMVVQACVDRGWLPEDDNEADALAILDYAAHLLRLPVEWTTNPLMKGEAA